VYAQEWLQPLLVNPESGIEQLYSYAAVGSRVSVAVTRYRTGQFAMHAEGPAFATGSVRFERPAGGALPALTIAAGSTVRTVDGRYYATTAVATFLATATATVVVETPVIAIAAGYDYNQVGQITTARGEILPGAVDTIVNIYQTPPYADASITVRQVLPIEGGVCGSLDILGYDRGVIREPGEPDETYRLRIRTLPDTLTPNAIRRRIAAYLDRYGIPWFFVEPWSLAYQTCWDAPSPNVGTPSYQATPPTNPMYNPNLFAYDWTAFTFRNYWLARADSRGAFGIFLQMPPETSPGSGVFLYPAFATQAEQNAVMLGFIAMINQIKAAGIQVFYKVYR
jgi:hypothetical protein